MGNILGGGGTQRTHTGTNQQFERGTEGTRSVAGTQGLPEWVQPYLQQGLTMAGEVADRPIQPYAGPAVAQRNPRYQQGRQALRDVAAQQGQYVDPVWQQVQSTLAGDYLDPEYLRQRAQPGIDAALSGINAGANLAGGRGSSLAAEAAGRAGAQEMAGVWNAERGRQQQAAQMVPGILDMLNRPGNLLMQQGLANQQQQQRNLDRRRELFEFGQAEPTTRAATYGGLLQGLLPFSGQETTQESDYGTAESGSSMGSTANEARGGGGGLLGPLGSIAGYALGGPLGGTIGGGLGGLLGGGTGMGLGSTGLDIGSATAGGFDPFAGSAAGLGSAGGGFGFGGSPFPAYGSLGYR